ncbi:MAG: hypothetical protein QM784_25455 [Polyangiaceae bacterium]
MTDFDVRPSSPPGQFPSCVITDVTPADSIAPRRLVLLLPPRDSATPDAPPFLAERGEILLAVPPTLEAKDVLVAHARASDEAEFIGVLRGVVVAPARDCLRFRRYEPFLSPVVSSLGQAQVDGATAAELSTHVRERVFRRDWSGAHKVEHPERVATGFAEFLLQHFTADRSVYKHAFALTRSNGPAHHVYHRRIKQRVVEYLESQRLSQHGYRIPTPTVFCEKARRELATRCSAATRSLPPASLAHSLVPSTTRFRRIRRREPNYAVAYSTRSPTSPREATTRPWHRPTPWRHPTFEPELPGARSRLHPQFPRRAETTAGAPVS